MKHSTFQSADDMSENWCKENSLSYPVLKLAVSVREDLLRIMERLELPQSAALNNQSKMEESVKKALLAGFFMQVV